MNDTIRNEFEKLTNLYKQKWCKHMYPQNWSEVLKHTNSIHPTQFLSHSNDDSILSWNEYGTHTGKWIMYVKQLNSKGFQSYAINKIVKEDLMGLHIYFDEYSLKELGRTVSKLNNLKHGLYSLEMILRKDPCETLIRDDWVNILSLCGRFPQNMQELIDCGASETIINLFNEKKQFKSEMYTVDLYTLFKRYNDNNWTNAMADYLFNKKHVNCLSTIKCCPYRHRTNESREFLKPPDWKIVLKRKNKIHETISQILKEDEFDKLKYDIDKLSERVNMKQIDLKNDFCDYQHKNDCFVRFKLLQCGNSSTPFMITFCKAYIDTLQPIYISKYEIHENILDFFEIKVPNIKFENEIDILKYISTHPPWVFTLM